MKVRTASLLNSFLYNGKTLVFLQYITLNLESCFYCLRFDSGLTGIEGTSVTVSGKSYFLAHPFLPVRIRKVFPKIDCYIKTENYGLAGLVNS